MEVKQPQLDMLISNDNNVIESTETDEKSPVMPRSSLASQYIDSPTLKHQPGRRIHPQNNSNTDTSVPSSILVNNLFRGTSLDENSGSKLNSPDDSLNKSKAGSKPTSKQHRRSHSIQGTAIGDIASTAASIEATSASKSRRASVGPIEINRARQISSRRLTTSEDLSSEDKPVRRKSTTAASTPKHRRSSGNFTPTPKQKKKVIFRTPLCDEINIDYSVLLQDASCMSRNSMEWGQGEMRATLSPKSKPSIMDDSNGRLDDEQIYDDSYTDNVGLRKKYKRKSRRWFGWRINGRSSFQWRNRYVDDSSSEDTSKDKGRKKTEVSSFCAIC